MTTSKDIRFTRDISESFITREDNEDLYLEGYFVVYNSNYDMGGGMSESIAPGAFTKSLGNDIRCLINHDTTLVLGRTSIGTFELKEDSHGLFGRCLINRYDTDAMNIYQRVKRGDVSGCSIGFTITKENTEILNDGNDIHWTIEEADLYEGSVCTFPAYEATTVSAREHDFEEIKKRNAEKWRETMLNKLKGVAK